MAKSYEDWMREGEEVYQGMVEEYQHIEEQLRDLATRWRAQKSKIDELAGKLGKTPLPEEQDAEPMTEAVPANSEGGRGPVPRMNLAGPAVRR